jgi:superfamily II DNA/RNA helicase
MNSFQELVLPASLQQALQKMNFNQPTPIQAQAIPLALNGRDILGSAQTGTGKTAAFAIPAIAHLIKNPTSRVLIMTPTRELAAQVMAAMKQMLSATPQIVGALLIGGESMFKQIQQLRAHPRLIVGTPGRINDHLEQRILKLDRADFLVLDETDRMLDMGFDVQIERIARHLPQKRQTLLFSATLPSRIVKMSERYLNNPARVAVGSTTAPIAKIHQELVHIPVAQKYGQLLEQLQKRQGSVIVFVKTKRGADRMAEKLTAAKIAAEAIHGNLRQNQRNRVIQSFRDKKYRVMVATDVAARGLDIPHIEHVINYDLPQQAEDYIHRIGRTGRAGAEGSAVCFIAPEDKKLWREIHILMNPGEKTARDDEASESAGRPQPQRRKSFGGQRREGGFKSGREGGFKPGREGGFKSSRDGGGYRGNREESRGGNREESRGGFRERDSRRDGIREAGNRDGAFREGNREESRGHSRGGFKGGFKKRSFAGRDKRSA